MSLTNVMVSILVMAGITAFTRAFPFIFFDNKQPPATILFLGKYIPPIIITILVFYCLKDTKWGLAPYGINELIAVLLVILLHLWKHNPLLSIFIPTLIYMFLTQTGVLVI